MKAGTSEGRRRSAGVSRGDPSLAFIRERRFVLALLLFCTAASWAALVWRGGMAMANSPALGAGAVAFLVLWVVMMAAMMLPSAAPMILAFHALEAGRQLGGAGKATWMFVAGYLALWTFVGLGAFVAASMAEALAARLALSSLFAARLAGALLVVAGLYQLTPLKDRCLATCRTPLTFLMTAWREGLAGAFVMGLRHGTWCFGCCALLFIVLFPLGVMNLGAMAVITLLICAEKLLPWPRGTTRIAALALALFGAAVLVAPSLLPVFSIGEPMEVPAGR